MNTIFVVNQCISLKDKGQPICGVYDSWLNARRAMNLYIDYYQKKRWISFRIEKIHLNQPLTPWNTHTILTYP